VRERDHHPRLPGVSDRVYTEHLATLRVRAWGVALETAESMVLIPKHAGARPPWAELAPDANPASGEGGLVFDLADYDQKTVRVPSVWHLTAVA